MAVCNGRVAVGIGRHTIGGGGLTWLSAIWSLFVELPEESLLLFKKLRALNVTCQHGLNNCGVVPSHLKGSNSQEVFLPDFIQ